MLLHPHHLFELNIFFYFVMRSEEHTSELQSLTNLVCRLLLEKKNDYDVWSRISVSVEASSRLSESRDCGSSTGWTSLSSGQGFLEVILTCRILCPLLCSMV